MLGRRKSPGGKACCRGRCGRWCYCLAASPAASCARRQGRVGRLGPDGPLHPGQPGRRHPAARPSPPDAPPDADDGVTASGLMPDVCLVSGLWRIDQGGGALERSFELRLGRTCGWHGPTAPVGLRLPAPPCLPCGLRRPCATSRPTGPAPAPRPHRPNSSSPPSNRKWQADRPDGTVRVQALRDRRRGRSGSSAAPGPSRRPAPDTAAQPG
jgi:hypothetical protein